MTDLNGQPPSRRTEPGLSWDFQAWPTALTALAGCLLLILIFYWGAISDAVYLWANRSAYNHCFLILPITAYLLWDNKAQLARSTPEPWGWGLVGVAGFAAVWLFAAAAGIAEGEHIAILGLIQTLILTILGHKIYRQNWLAFTYLWLLVPTGTFLIPFLQELATVQTYWWLELFNIPTFREGNFIEVPTGTYRIAPGCAGLNFVLSAIALTPLYAYLIYQSWQKRLAALVIMVAIAIFTNALRIFIIIALAEWSDRRIDIVDDHLLYGWGFFALILLVAGYIGLRFEDPLPKSEDSDHAASGAAKLSPVTLGSIAAAAAAIVILAPLYYGNTQSAPAATSVNMVWPNTNQNWQRVDVQDPIWSPVFPAAHHFELAHYANSQAQVDMAIAYYTKQTEDAELLNQANSPTGDEIWQKVTQSRRMVQIDERQVDVIETLVKDSRASYLVWHWYWVDDQLTSRTLKAKLLQTKVTLLTGTPDAAAIVAATEIRSDQEQARQHLANFFEGPFSVQKILRSTSSSSPQP